MPGPNSPRSVDSRLDLVEYQIAELTLSLSHLTAEIKGLRDDVNARFSRANLTAWALISSVTGGAAAMIIAAVVLHSR